MYQYILFDLDGTLCDTSEGILRSVQYALEKMGEPAAPKDALQVFIGPPLVPTLMEQYAYSEAQAKQATVYYRERYSVTGLYESTPYPGIAELLARLRNAGRVLAVATSKQTPYAPTLLAHVGLAEYFTFVGCSELDGSRDSKEAVVRYTLDSLGVAPADYGKAVLVGDRKYDVIGGHAVGIDVIGVRYGFMSPGELEAAGAECIVDDVAALSRVLLGETA